MPVAVCGILTSAFAAPAGAAAAPCQGATDLPAQVSASDSKAATLCLVNRERTRRGIPSLGANRALATAARGHANDMVVRQYFSHMSQAGEDFFDRIKDAGYGGSSRIMLAGENLAWGSGELATPEAIVAAWMASPGHRTNILRRGFREIGIAVVDGTPVAGGMVGATYATSFGHRTLR